MASSVKSDGGIVETIKTVFYALLIALVFRSVFFQPFWIPTESMKSSLLIGDFIFVNKMAYGYSRYSCEIPVLGISACPISGRILGSEPERGDVAVFRHPTNGTDYIKRVIGLPGDTIQVKAGLVYINGEVAPQVPDGVFEEINAPQGPLGNRPRCETIVGEGAICSKSQAVETLPNGKSHNVLNVDVNGAGDNTDIFTVPPENYFFMGDNRDNSLDSRFSINTGGVGYVPAEFLIGRADRVIFSSAGKSLFYFWTWRSDRFFKAVE